MRHCTQLPSVTGQQVDMSGVESVVFAVPHSADNVLAVFVSVEVDGHKVVAAISVYVHSNIRLVPR